MINNIFSQIYFENKSEEIRRGRSKLKRMKIDSIIRILDKNCKMKGVEYVILEKNYNSVSLHLKGKYKENLFRYHRTDMVFKEDYEEFLNAMKNQGINKGIYITTGVFEAGLHKRENRTWFFKKIVLEDYRYFFKRQLGLRGRVSDLFKNKKISFYKYLPD